MRTAVACFVLAAAIATPGIVVAATSSTKPQTPFNVIYSGTATGTGTFVPETPMAPDVRRVEDSLQRAFGTELRFFPVARKTIETFPSGKSRCPLDVVLSTRSQPQPPFFPTCFTGTTRWKDVWITYSPPSVRPTVERALASLPR